MFKKKPPEGSGSPQAAAPGGKAGFLRRRWPLLIIAGAAIVGGVVWMTQVRATQAPAEAAYIETKPTRRSITNIYSEDGTVETAESYQVKSLVRGDVLTADFEEGDMVQEGDVLYTIDSADAVNSVERAQLTLSQAQRDYEDAVDAQYVRTGIGGTVVSIAAAPGDVVTAGQEIATIRDESAMLLTLDFPAADAAQFAAGQAAEITLDGTYEKLAGTVRSVSGADTLSSGNMLVRSVTITVPNSGGLTASQAATASVNGVSALGSARLSYQNGQTLTAPADGTVAALCVQEGSSVGAGSAIVQLTSDNLTRQAEQAADSLRSAELSMEDADHLTTHHHCPHQRHHHFRHHDLPRHHPHRRLRRADAGHERDRLHRGGQRRKRPFHPQRGRGAGRLRPGHGGFAQRGQRRRYGRPGRLCLRQGRDRRQ